MCISIYLSIHVILCINMCAGSRAPLSVVLLLCRRVRPHKHHPPTTPPRRLLTLHAEYAERITQYGILFIFSLFCEHVNLEYVRIHVL